jgi:hypothetical protein
MHEPNTDQPNSRFSWAITGATPAWLERLAWLAAGLTLAHALFILFHGLNGPLIDQHGFRQTQTALSARELMRGGPFLRYLTPVVGSPWSIPFEVPIYQWIVARVASTGLPLEAAGRLVSFGFFAAGFWPLRMLWRDLRLPPLGLPITCALIAGSPQYGFWSRTFLIESCVWFFALLWLACFVRFLTARRPVHALAALAAGVLAVLTKSTTFPAFALAGGLIMAPTAWRFLRDGLPRGDRAAAALALMALLPPFVAGAVWVGYSDQVKAENPIGALLTSGALSLWTFGNWTQRAHLLGRDVGGVVMMDMFGYGAILIPPLLIAGCRVGRRETVAILICVSAFVTPFLIFTNLFSVHNYYRYANDAFLLAAAGIASAAVARTRRGPALVAAGLVLILGTQFLRFQAVQGRWMAVSPARDPLLQIGLAARSLTSRDDGLIILGNDWDSTIPFYADRWALVMPEWVPDERANDILDNPARHLAGRRFAGVVHCDFGNPPANPGRIARERAFLSGRTVLARSGPCELLSAGQ